MRYRRSLPLALAGILVAGATAALPMVAEDKDPGGDLTPVTLRLLMNEDRDRPPGVVADDLARLIKESSGGGLLVAPELGEDVALAVLGGDADLGIVPARDWEAQGVTSLHALDAPLLIDNDALALAVADSDVAAEAMAGLASVGLEGLMMWPDDLRHLYAFKPSGHTLEVPGDIVGAPIHAVGKASADLMEALGGSLWVEGEAAGGSTGDKHTDASSGALAGMISGLGGQGVPVRDQTVVAGDLVLHPKYYVLVANREALGQLSDEQREMLDEAVSAAQQGALARRASETDLASEACADGVEIISIGAEAVASFRAAAMPLYEAMTSDAVTGPIIVDIEALKASTPASPAAGACEGAGPSSADVTAPDLTTYLGTKPPVGTYRADITEADLVARGATADFAARNSAIVTFTFDEDTYTYTGAEGVTCPGQMSSDGTAVSLNEDPGNPCGLGGAYVWQVSPEGILLGLPYLEGLLPREQADLRAFFEREWVRID